MNLVFTGPAYDGSGKPILRDNLIAACLSTGILNVRASVTATTDILVASRKDTAKAKAAIARGITVMTYPELIASYLRKVAIPKGGKPNKYADGVSLDLLVPVFTDVFTENDLL